MPTNNIFSVIGHVRGLSVPGDMEGTGLHDACTALVLDKCLTPSGKPPPKGSRVELMLRIIPDAPADVPNAPEHEPGEERVS